MNYKKKTFVIFSFISFIIFVLDRIIKIYIMKTSPDGEVFILGDFLKLEVAFNSGVAFSLPINYYFLIFIYIVILVGLVWVGIWFYRQKKYASISVNLLILLGAASNLIDRLYLGKVIDYISVKYYSVFNLADVMIVLGVIGLIFINYKSDKKSEME